MRRTAAYRFTSDICFFYSVLSFSPAMLSLQKPMALFALACLAVSLAAVYCPWAPVRFLLALLPGLAFLQAAFRFALIFPALAWLYLILVLTAGRFHTWLEEYRRSYKIMMLLYLLILAGCILLDMLSRGIVVFLPSMIYVTASLCLGALAMRRMQMNAEMNFRWNLANGVVSAGVPLLAIGFSYGLYQLLRSLRPVYSRLSYLLAVFLSSLINTLFPSHPELLDVSPSPSLPPSPTPTPEQVDEISGYEESELPFEFDWKIDLAAIEKAARIFLFVLIVLLLLVLVILIVRRALRNRAKSDQQDFSYLETEVGKPFRRRKGHAVTASSNARQIRLLYQQYLEVLQARGIIIRKHSTSREILNEAELHNFSPDAKRLRELYLKARYGDGELVTPEDIQEAAICLKKIREDEAWKD